MLLKHLPQEKVQKAQKSEENQEDVMPVDVSVKQAYINRELGLQYCMDSVDFYKEMLTLYKDGYEQNLAKLTEAYRAQDWENYTVYVHALKSTSLNIGGELVSKAAKELENAGKELRESKQETENRMFIMEHHDATMKLYHATVEAAKTILEE